MTEPTRHPSLTAILRYFAWQHLPEHLQAVSQPFGQLAEHLADTLPSGPELTTALRKLLESKDCAVRAALDEPMGDLLRTAWTKAAEHFEPTPSAP